MTIVLDANVLLRLADPTCAARPTAIEAVRLLLARGESLRIVPQTLYEYWVVATRPIVNNGLGLSSPQCSRDVATITAMFQLLNDAPGQWRAIVDAFACLGKVAHDARYVAAMRILGVTQLLTFNHADFARFSDIEAIDPAALTGKSSN